MQEDERLIRKLKRGDRDALCQIYLRHKDNLLTIAVSLLNDTWAAEDVLHDVFVSFATGIGRLQLRGSLRNYLVTCVVNRVRDGFRRKRPHTVALEEVAVTDSSADGPVRAAIKNERASILTDALTQIPLKQRETIVLHLNAAMTFKQIAQMQGIPLATVQARYRYGLEKLRTIMDGEVAG